MTNGCVESCSCPGGCITVRSSRGAIALGDGGIVVVGIAVIRVITVRIKLSVVRPTRSHTRPRLSRLLGGDTL